MNYHRHAERVSYDLGEHLAVHFSHEVLANVQPKTISFDAMTIASPVKRIKEVRQFFLFQTAPRIFDADKLAIFLLITKDSDTIPVTIFDGILHNILKDFYQAILITF